MKQTYAQWFLKNHGWKGLTEADILNCSASYLKGIEKHNEIRNGFDPDGLTISAHLENYGDEYWDYLSR